MNKNYIEIQFDGTTLSYDEIMSLVDRNKEKIKLDRVWKATISKIPTLNFKEDWDVKVIPCFGGVVTLDRTRDLEHDAEEHRGHRTR